jgi:predicted ribosome quality control (RQC) complex YloA/Tae2 family protein
MKTQYVHIPSLQQEVVYYIGCTAKDNFAVVDQMQSDQDIWFHAGAGISSCHVVCILAGIAPLTKKARRQIITQGALLCKRHTAKLRSLENVAIQYAPLHQVVKTDVEGKVIVHGGGYVSM